MLRVAARYNAYNPLSVDMGSQSDRETERRCLGGRRALPALLGAPTLGDRGRACKAITCISVPTASFRAVEWIVHSSLFLHSEILNRSFFMKKAESANDLHVEVTAGVLSRRAPPHMQRSRGPRPERYARCAF